jgi:hypothetical protein
LAVKGVTFWAIFRDTPRSPLLAKDARQGNAARLAPSKVRPEPPQGKRRQRRAALGGNLRLSALLFEFLFGRPRILAISGIGRSRGVALWRAPFKGFAPEDSLARDIVARAVS